MGHMRSPPRRLPHCHSNPLGQSAPARGWHTGKEAMDTHHSLFPFLLCQSCPRKTRGEGSTPTSCSRDASPKGGEERVRGCPGRKQRTLQSIPPNPKLGGRAHPDKKRSALCRTANIPLPCPQPTEGPKGWAFLHQTPGNYRVTYDASLPHEQGLGSGTRQVERPRRIWGLRVPIPWLLPTSSSSLTSGGVSGNAKMQL